MPSFFVTLRLTSLAALAAFGSTAASGENPQTVAADISVITPDEGRYYNGWPTLARQKNGSLIVVWSGGRDAHVCPFGRVESMSSQDEGKNWSWPRVLFDSAIDDRDAGVLVTARGTLLVTSFNSLVYNTPRNREKYPQQKDKWDRHERGLSVANKERAHLAYLLRSEDGGTTWSTAQLIPVSSPHGPLQLDDGRLLYPGVQRAGADPHDPTATRRIGVWESKDDGHTWTFLSPLPARPGDNPNDYHEFHGVQASNGTIVVQIRSHADESNRQMLQTLSTDGGRTWSVPRTLGIFGYPPHLMRLRDGRLLVSYDHRRAPYGVQARVSTDAGTTWSEPLAITSNAVKLDQGYPSTVELGNGQLLTVWYEIPPGAKKAVLKQARWSLPALLP
ncbi:MAG TPA: sialidase family protein [Opitutaceae bacterium]|nr:sialidase family protein [Opitutaceae bacterium]